jgi:hypothetical protein
MSMSKPNSKTKTKENKKRVKTQSKRQPKRGILPKSNAQAKRLDEEERQVAETAKRRRKARASAKDVLSAIGYDAMYADGIAQVEEGLFSLTAEFGDISYQSAREESQQSVFAAMSELYDYFGGETGVQLTITNVPIPAAEVGRKTFFHHSDPRCDAYVDEYNRILNDKMREGVSNLVRHRYLTFMVGADDVDAAAPKLARAKNDCMQTLARIRCDAYALNGEERLRLLQSQLRPASDFEFSWDKLSHSCGLRTKDLIAPQVLDFKPGGRNDCYLSDETWCRVMAFRSFGSDLEDDCLANIVDLPIPLNVTLHVHPLEKSAAVAYVKKRIAWMDKEVIDEQMSAVKKGYDFSILPPELTHSKEEAEELLDQLQNKNQRLFTYTGLAFTYAETSEELDRQTRQIMAAARQRSIEVEPLAYRQRQGMNSILPLGMNHVEVSRYMTTAQVAIQMPFASQELNQEGGGYYGQSKQSGNLVICNRKLLASPMGFVCGKPGSGKSFSVKREIMNTILAYPNDEVIVFDPAGEYAPVVEPAGGTSIRFAPDTETFMNPFDLSDVADKASQAQLAFKIDAILALSSATMAEGREGLPEADKSIISRCVENAYAQCGKEGRLPTLEDFHTLLLEQPEPEARDIALRYERYVKGALSFFNHQSNVGFDARITNVDFKDLSSNMRVFGMLTALEAVRNRMYSNFERGVTTWLYIDEVQSLFGHPAIISYFSKFWAEGRKFNLICTGITQNSTYMLEHEDARNMVLNSDFCLLHKQSHLDRKSWVDLLSLSAQEESYIDDSIKAGEGLLVAGGVRVPLKDDFPKGGLYDLFNTKPEEIAKIKRAQALARAQGK